MNETVQIRVHGEASLPTLIYLPGLHGDWTLIGGFRKCLGNRVRFVELAYPHGSTWTLPTLTHAILEKFQEHGIERG